MTQILYRPRDEQVMYVVETDSMGRTPEQIEAMEKNEAKPPRLGKRDKAHAQRVAIENATYPKVLYRLALRKGIPAGDELAPSYPMPFDLAQNLGVSDKGFKVLGKTRDSGGYILLRHPYVTMRVAVFVNDDPNGLIDHKASYALEQKLVADGWVDHPNKIEGLPEEQVEEPFDPVPLPAKKAQKPAQV
jgi:hypothetical protein